MSAIGLWLLGKIPFLRFWKPILAVAVLAALVIAWKVHDHNVYAKGEHDGSLRVTKQWNDEKLVQKAILDKRNAQERAKEAAAEKHNEEIEREHASQAAAALADRDSLFRMLQRERATTATIRTSQTESLAAAITAAQESRGREIDEALAGVITEKRLNDLQLAALIAEITPQLSPPAP